MKKVMAISVLLAMIFLSACGQSAVSEAVSSVETVSVAVSSEVVTAPPVTVTAALPDGWMSIESTLPVHLNYINDTASIMVSQNDMTGALADVVAQSKIDVGKIYYSISYIGTDESIKVDGRDAVRYTFNCKYSSIDKKYQYIYVTVGEYTYCIIFGDYQDTFDSHAAEYEKFLADIKFVEQA